MPTPILGPTPRGVSQSDVSHAADSLLRLGERPTNDKVRAKIGKGSLSTIGPLLDAWWNTLSARLDAGPAAFHRLPETVAHIAEALWMQALEEGKRRAAMEQRDNARVTELDKQRLEVRSHVLTLREGEFDSRLRDRDRTIEELNMRLSELSGALRKEQAMRESLVRQLADLQVAGNRNQKRLRSARSTKGAKTTKRMRKPVKTAVAKRPPKRVRKKPR
jgi:Plasmid replication region DNA-binding N-term